MTHHPFTLPEDIIEAAFKVSQWMEAHNQEYWQIGNVCDRRYAVRVQQLRQKQYIEHSIKNITWDGWYD